MRTLAYMAVYFLLLQLSLDAIIPTRWFYHYRLEYEVAKQNMARWLHRAMDEIAADIKRNQPQEYVIILGDSVAYSGPGGPEQSIGWYLEELGRARGRQVRVYNLAQPAMQAGDIYTVLLMLGEHGIPLDRVVINLIYAGFAARAPDPPVVFWLGDELRRLDPETWNQVRPNLEANGWTRTEPSWQVRLRERLLGGLALWRNREVLQGQINGIIGAAATAGEVRDLRPWYQKENVRELVRQPMYQRMVDPRPFDMSPANPQIALLKRIIAKTRPALQTLFFLTPLNQELMAEWVQAPGYRENLDRIDAWFAGQAVAYANLEQAIPPDQFADHVHLIPSGYQRLAALLGEHLFADPPR